MMEWYVDRSKFLGTWTLVSVTDHEGNITERGVRRAGAKVTLAGRPHPGLQFAYEYADGSGVNVTSRIIDWERTTSLGNPDKLVVKTMNSVYTFVKEAAPVD